MGTSTGWDLTDMEAHRWGHAEAGLDLIGRAVQHAMVAGGLRGLARAEPEVARGLIRVAEAHTARCNALLGQAIAPGARGVRRSC